jgi:hypothetical protein
MTPFEQWCTRYPDAAQALLGVVIPQCNFDIPNNTGEAVVQAEVRMEASRLGKRLWRNNVGVLPDQNGRPVRYGLCNDSKAVNTEIKSADLIGLEPVLITQEMVGTTIGRFLSREVKAANWKWSGTKREMAQLAWANIVNGLGGNAAIVTGPGSLY